MGFHPLIAMIPARMGSQRLKQKNLQKIDGKTLIERAIIKAKQAACFDEIWVNSESDIIGQIALNQSVYFHKRPEHLADNKATSEQFVTEFLEKRHCEWVIQLHSIAPLIKIQEIREFVAFTINSSADVILSYEPMQIECVFKDKPINFTFSKKTNSQELTPIKRISWSITAWRKKTFMEAVALNQCATYVGKVDYFPLSPLASHVIKTEYDLKFAETMLPLVN